MMLQFTREQILPLVLERRITVAELARMAGVNPRTVERAVTGRPVTLPVVDKIAKALNVDALKFLAPAAQI